VSVSCCKLEPTEVVAPQCSALLSAQWRLSAQLCSVLSGASVLSSAQCSVLLLARLLPMNGCVERGMRPCSLSTNMLLTYTCLCLRQENNSLVGLGVSGCMPADSASTHLLHLSPSVSLLVCVCGGGNWSQCMKCILHCSCMLPSPGTLPLAASVRECCMGCAFEQK